MMNSYLWDKHLIPCGIHQTGRIKGAGLDVRDEFSRNKISVSPFNLPARFKT